jgi:hypothetical protein
MSPRPLGLRWSLLAIALAWGTPAAAAPVRLSPAPIPSWVTPIEPDLSKRPRARTQGGTENLLLETQTRFGPRGRSHFIHWADRVASAEGLDEVSPISIELDPSYEQVGVHFLRVRRGGRTIDGLRGATVKFVDVEAELDRRLFDGRRSLVIVPRDLREGDVVEVALTTTGSNPVFGGHAMGNLFLGGEPIRRLRARLLVDPELPPLRFKLLGGAPEPRKIPTEAGQEYLWDLADTADSEDEDRTPPWFDDHPSADWSDFGSWDAVRDWALPLYPPRAPAPALGQRVKRWQQAHASVQERVLAALRFVQDDVRYLGFELGPNSHAPHAPDQVLAQRFGDCKDKSYLLVTLLRAMGVEADTALVDSTPDARLDQRLPSPYAFDHAIVRAIVDGRVHWLDPTLGQQGGTLRTQATPRYGHALVLRAGAHGLERIPEDPGTDPLVRLKERYRVETDGAATLEIETTYRETSADWARGHYTSDSPDQLTRRFLNFYAKRHPTITVVKPAGVTDDRRLNQVVLRESYAIPGFWHDDEIWLRGHLIDDELQEPSVRLRKTPLWLDHPVRKEHLIEVLLPTVFDVQLADDTVEADGISFHQTVGQSGRLISMRFRFATTAPYIPAPEVPRHLATLDKVDDLLDFRLAKGDARQGRRKASGRETAVAIAVVLVTLVVPVGLLIVGRGLYRKARRRAARRRYDLAAGESAVAALTVASLDDVAATGARVRCACGGRMTPVPDAPLETVRLGEQEVRSSRFRCDRCGLARPLYFRLGA